MAATSMDHLSKLENQGIYSLREAVNKSPRGEKQLPCSQKLTAIGDFANNQN